jgi:hypothetical protein
MFSNLIGIGGKGKGLAEKFTVNNSISFEVVGTPGLINFYVYCPKKFAEHVEKQILGHIKMLMLERLKSTTI